MEKRKGGVKGGREKRGRRKEEDKLGNEQWKDPHKYEAIRICISKVTCVPEKLHILHI